LARVALRLSHCHCGAEASLPRAFSPDIKIKVLDVDLLEIDYTDICVGHTESPDREAWR
jgi:hypothetical protein